MRILRISPIKIVTHIAFWCLLKMLVLSLISGVSMACSDGVNCSVGFWMTILAICPLFVYLAGAGVLIYEEITNKDTYAIVRALQTTYTVHVYAIAAFLLCVFVSAYMLDFSSGSLHPIVAIFVIPIARLIILTSTMIFVYWRCKTKQKLYQSK